jgi:hypothetical protein
VWHTRKDLFPTTNDGAFFLPVRQLFADNGSINTDPALCLPQMTFTQFSIELRLGQSPHFTSSESQRSIVCPHSSGINQQIVSSFKVQNFTFSQRVKNLLTTHVVRKNS